MKNAFFNLSTFILLSLVLSSCSSNDDENIDGEFMSATIVDFVAFNATTENFNITAFDATIRTGQNGIFLDFFARMDGVNANFSEIGGKIYNYTGAGLYTTGENVEDLDLLYFNDRQQSYYFSDKNAIEFNGFENGVINITKDDGVFVEGTFNFVCFKDNGIDSKNVTNGTFKIKY